MARNGTAIRRARPRGKPQDGELSSERIAFCEGILEGKGHRVAYEESGFKARGKDAATNARPLLKEPEVQTYLAARRVALREAKRTAAERVIDEVSALAFANLAEFGADELNGSHPEIRKSLLLIQKRRTRGS